MRTVRKLILTISLLGLGLTAAACTVCEKQQPKLLKGITHGTGPESKWDYVIVLVMTVIVLLTLFYTIKWLVNPGEKSDNHIKMFILNND